MVAPREIKGSNLRLYPKGGYNLSLNWVREYPQMKHDSTGNGHRNPNKNYLAGRGGIHLIFKILDDLDIS